MVLFRVDQSGKWEEPRDTVLGVEGPRGFSVLFPHREKMRLHAVLARFRQEQGRTKKDTILRFFAYALFLALLDAFREGDVIVIDEEYPGHEERIRDIFLDCFSRHRGLAPNRFDVRFERVGKNSLCHQLASSTWQGRRKPDCVFRAEDFWALLDRTREIREKAFRKRLEKKRKGATGFSPARWSRQRG